MIETTIKDIADKYGAFYCIVDRKYNPTADLPYAYSRKFIEERIGWPKGILSDCSISAAVERYEKEWEKFEAALSAKEKVYKRLADSAYLKSSLKILNLRKQLRPASPLSNFVYKLKSFPFRFVLTEVAKNEHGWTITTETKFVYLSEKMVTQSVIEARKLQEKQINPYFSPEESSLVDHVIRLNMGQKVVLPEVGDKLYVGLDSNPEDLTFNYTLATVVEVEVVNGKITVVLEDELSCLMVVDLDLNSKARVSTAYLFDDFVIISDSELEHQNVPDKKRRTAMAVPAVNQRMVKMLLLSLLPEKEAEYCPFQRLVDTTRDTGKKVSADRWVMAAVYLIVKDHGKDKQFSVKDIQNKISENGVTLGDRTVSRAMVKLVESGNLTRRAIYSKYGTSYVYKKYMYQVPAEIK